jgi:regulatory protein
MRSRRDPNLPPEERAREICLAALERRPHSRQELEVLLRRKSIGEEVATPLLDRLAGTGLIDDTEFARAFVASRQRTRPRGRRGLAAELRQRGVSAEIIDEVLGETEEGEDPVEAARRAVAGKLRSLSRLPSAQQRRKAEQFLLRRGFDYDTIRQALSGLAADE